MKKTKIILSAAAFIMTAVSAVAFKITHRLSTGNRVYGLNAIGACTLTTCRTSPTGKAKALCHTVVDLVAVVYTNGLGELWKKRNIDGTCTNPTFYWTVGTK